MSAFTNFALQRPGSDSPSATTATASSAALRPIVWAAGRSLLADLALTFLVSIVARTGGLHEPGLARLYPPALSMWPLSPHYLIFWIAVVSRAQASNSRPTSLTRLRAPQFAVLRVDDVTPAAAAACSAHDEKACSVDSEGVF
jgi:hypothetical protein